MIFVAFLIQFFIGCRTSCKALRCIPLYCSGIALAFMAAASASGKNFHAIVAAIWGMIGICFLLGYGLAILTDQAYRLGKTND